ncbi:MAG: thermonuclease family protein [Dehalococcoidales bacterium]|nr:thermonuclease family protein [Dehalococcoidales bacterium]
MSATSPIQEMASEINYELPSFPTGETSKATVTRIIDGDTIEINQSGSTYKVRYIGVDTPEADEYGYDKATEVNRRLVYGKQIILEKDISEIDRYERLLRYVWVDGCMVNAVLVGTGYAAAVEYPPDIEYSETFRDLAVYAADNLSGLWSYRGFSGFSH